MKSVTTILCFWIVFIVLFIKSALGAENLIGSGVNQVFQTGHNAAASPGDDVYSADGAFPFLDAASSLMLSASSGSDTAAGTGCRTVLVEGLDGSYNYQSETVTLSAQAPVTLTSTWFRINKLSCVTVGSGGINAGIIGLTGVASTSTTFYAHMPASYGVSQQAIYSSPLDKVATGLEGYDFSCGASSTCQVAVQLQMREFGKSWRVLDTATGNDSAGIVKKLFGSWLLVPPKADIRLRVLSVGTSGQRVNGNLHIMQKR